MSADFQQARPADTGRVLLRQLRQELLGPAGAALGLCELLLADARERGHAGFLADAEALHREARGLFAWLHEALRPASGGEDGPEAVVRRIRHQLGNKLNHVGGYCQLMLNSRELFLDAFRADLREVREYCRRCEARVAEWSREENRGAAEDVANRLRHSPPRHADARPGRVLVVDDDEANRETLRRMLEEEGHAVETAEDGQRAMEQMGDRPFDVVLLDILMPRMTGLQVLELLYTLPDARPPSVLVVSALGDTASVVRCIEMGAEDYLTKPCDQVLLRARVGACLEKRRLRDRADELLHAVFPAEIARELKETGDVRPRRHEGVAVLFADIVGFTPFCDARQPEEVLRLLQRLAADWEASAERHGVQKIKTIGDAFMGAAGLQRAENPVLDCVECGQEMIAAAQRLGWDARVGVHVGPVVAGKLGCRQYGFDLWGATVNTAARMESHGTPGKVTLSGAAWERVVRVGRGEPRKEQIKGIGEMVVVRFDGFVR